MSGRAFEIDHVFVLTDAGAPGADTLVELGLTEGTPNRHPGQGTSCRRFFFENAMFEILWIHDTKEAASQQTQPTRLLDRWRRRGNDACPFGICFRAAEGSPRPPFPTWQYCPDYIRGPLAIHIATNSDALHEPMLFYLPFVTRAASASVRQPLRHAIGFREVTRVQWTGPCARPPSPELETALSCGLTTATGPAHELHVGFDHEAQGRRVSLAPALPLTLHW